MNGLENFEPFNDLEDWSNNVDLFMEAIANPTERADVLWKLAKGKAKVQELASQFMTNPGSRNLKGLLLLNHGCMDERERSSC